MDEIELRDATITALAKSALGEFKRAGLTSEEAYDEAISFAYSAAEVLRDRLAETPALSEEQA